jgi:putative ABC transport system permease protein
MRVADLVALATGALRGHRLRTVLSLTGVAIGVAAVILLTSLGEGARTYVTHEFTSLGANLLIVFPGKTETTGLAPIFGGAPHDLTLDDVDAIRRRLPYVVAAAPLTIGRATARFGERSREVAIAGTTADYHRIRRLQMSMGSSLPERGAEADRAMCLIGAKIQAELFPGMNPLGQTLRVGDERFRVIGVTAARGGTALGTDVDDLVTIPIRRHMRMFNTTTLFRVLIEARSHRDLDTLRQAVIAVLKERHSGEEDVTVLTQDAMLSSFGNILTLLTSLLAGIGAISLTVAGVGVMNVMLVSVSERTREIGLLKALGATARQVLVLFLLEATLLAAAGGAVGIIIAWTVTTVFTALYPSFPVQPPAWAVGSALAVSAGVGVGFGAWPARRAAGLDPIVALSKR